MFGALANTHGMAKQKFRPTRPSVFSGVKAYIGYVEVLKKAITPWGVLFATPSCLQPILIPIHLQQVQIKLPKNMASAASRPDFRPGCGDIKQQGDTPKEKEASIQLSELPRAYAHGILRAKLRLPAGVYSSGNFHPQAHAFGITK